MDSVTLAYAIHSQGKQQHILSFFYGQRHRRELEFATEAATALGVKQTTINLADVGKMLKGSSLTDHIPVPEGHYEAATMKQTIVPGRNAIMLSIAWGVAVAEQAQGVACAVHAGDHFIYEDCRPQFINALSGALQLGSPEGYDGSIIAPFLNKTKADILREGMKLHVPYDRTRTCYQYDPIACGKCGSCVERLSSFAEIGVEDPLQYQDRTIWKKFVEEFKTATK